MKKINVKTALMTCAVLMASFGAMAQEEAPKNMIVRDDALIVCRSKQCKPAKSIMTKEFLYNKLASMLKNNVNQRLLLCEANPNTHTCINDAIVFNAMVGASRTKVALPSAFIVDAKMMNDYATENFILDYELSVGDTYPECQAALNKLTVASLDEIFIETPGFECLFTKNGSTAVNASYDIDYVDLDYGILGARYSIGLGQVSQGGAFGYALLRFENGANDNNEFLRDCGCSCNEQQNPPCQCAKAGNTGNAASAQASGAEPQVIIQEKVVTQYEVAPIEVYVKTKAPIAEGTTQPVKVNGVVVPNVPVVTEVTTEEQQILKPDYPVITEVEELK